MCHIVSGNFLLPELQNCHGLDTHIAMRSWLRLSLGTESHVFLRLCSQVHLFDLVTERSLLPSDFTHSRPPELSLKSPDLFPLQIRYLPESKIDLNSGQWNDVGARGGYFPFSTDMPFLQHTWPRGAADTRAYVFAAHQWWTQAMLYYLANDAEVRAMQPALADEMATWGLAADEYVDTDHWTPQLYVRESVRLRGAQVRGGRGMDMYAHAHAL